MAGTKGWLKTATLLVSGMLSACNLWGTNMKADEFFEPKQVELLAAIQQGDGEKARSMLDREDITLNTHGKDGITPLFWLIIEQDSAAIELALELGADPNFQSAEGRYPVATIAGGNDNRMLELLLEHGADPNVRDLDGKPALFSAIGQEHWPHIKMLLEYGADPNVTDGPNRNSAHYAAMINKFEIAHFLIEKGADPTNRNDAGGDIAWVIHEGLSENLLNPEFPAYGWALKVKEQLQERGVEFPPPSPKEIREQRKQRPDE